MNNTNVKWFGTDVASHARHILTGHAEMCLKFKEPDTMLTETRRKVEPLNCLNSYVVFQLKDCEREGSTNTSI